MSQPEPLNLNRAMELRAKLRNAHEAVMLDDAQAMLKADRSAVETHRRTMLDGHQSPSEDDDMGVQIDSPTTTNITHNHPAPPAKSGMSTVGKIAAAGIAATGLGLPIAGALALPTVLDAIKPDAPAAVDTDTDSDTAYVLRLGRPGEAAE